MAHTQDVGTQTQDEASPNALRRATRSDSASTFETMNEQTDIKLDGSEVDKTPVTILPQVRECNWQSFMNDLRPDGPEYAIDVLLAGPTFEADKRDENIRRHRLRVRGYGSELPGLVPKEGESQGWIEFVRIRSIPLLNVFSRVTGYNWGHTPRVFGPPFKGMIHFHDAFLDEYRKLQKALIDYNSPTSEANMPPSHFKNDEGLSSILSDKTHCPSQAVDGHDPLLEIRQTLDHLQCYIEFVEKSVISRVKSIRSQNISNSVKVRFAELWHIFKPGDLIYMPPKTLEDWMRPIAKRRGFIEYESDPGHASSMQQMVWRLYSVQGNIDVQTQTVVSFTAFCYYLDYNGTSYGALSCAFDIPEFVGQKEVKELRFYPLRFSPDAQDILQEAKHIGGLFTDYISSGHLSYEGWSMITNPVGVPIPDLSTWNVRLRQVQPEYIDSEVVVDFKEAYNECPWYYEKFSNYEPSHNGLTQADGYGLFDRFLTWEGTKVISSRIEIVYSMNDVDQLEQNDFLENELYLKRSSSRKPVPTGDDLALLPRRVFVQVLNTRQFLPVDVRYLKRHRAEPDAFDNVELPNMHKAMIQAAIRSHLRKQDMEFRLEQKGITEKKAQDFIHKKGNGLVIMLHGEPGVGKTATAEAIARYTGRPLCSIACGSLADAEDLKSELDEIFRMAHKYKCILLLDEADVLLTARSSTGDLDRNAMVSIFLQKVEYYSGILFLTTNRIGKLDQAVSSRIHLILHYKRLGQDRTQKVFKSNIKRLQEIEEQEHDVTTDCPLFVVESDIMRFAEDHCRKHPNGKGAWNGRQIRNAFTMAASLARFEADAINDKKYQPQLRYSHFEEVEKIMTEFDLFRANILGGDDARKARLNEERDDDYEPDDADRQNPAPALFTMQYPPLGNRNIHVKDRIRTLQPMSSGSSASYRQPYPMHPGGTLREIDRLQVGTPNTSPEYDRFSSQGTGEQAGRQWGPQPLHPAITTTPEHMNTSRETTQMTSDSGPNSSPHTRLSPQYPLRMGGHHSNYYTASHSPGSPSSDGIEQDGQTSLSEE
ncbi:hypothetical protein GGR57DRAFT_481256 [Xylariaceae sp. FL1272]|nr:hypothetical protein GGR57DRAFT_481256 [Xylariaceae sp. FL1272]